DTAGAATGRRPDGLSLLPFARDARKRSGRDILLETTTYSAIHPPRYVFVQPSTGEQELYDLKTDPYQLTSLHADPRYKALKDELAARLTRPKSCVGDARRVVPAVRPKVRPRHGRGGCVRGRVRLKVAGAETRRVRS